MNRAEVMRLAREAGVHALEASDALAPFLERFAALVRSAALEEAAAECAVLADGPGWPWAEYAECASAIRALKLGQPQQPQSGDFATAVPTSASTAQTTEQPWCGCGDGIMPDTGAKCWFCVANDEDEIDQLRAQNKELREVLRAVGSALEADKRDSKEGGNA